MNTQELIYMAILNGQSTIEIDGRTYELPEPQTTGTITQRKAYAKITAQQLIKKS